MSGTVWRIEDPEPNPTPPGIVQGSWMSLHYLRSALQRGWRLVAAATTAGLLLAVAMLVLVPAPSTASATLLLAHDASADPLTAIQTDESLLETLTLSQQVVDELDLPISADALRASFTANPVSTQILKIDLRASTAQEAVRRLNSLTSHFLTFRNGQLQGQAEKVIAADTARMDDLRKQSDTYAKQYEAALADGNSQLATDLLANKTALLTQIGTLQSTVQDTAVQTEALAAASHVVDPAAPVPVSQKKRVALGLMSGVILGGALGVALVFVHALISNRLRRREEVATALGRPVTYSAGPVRGRLPWGRKRRKRNLGILAAGLIAALPDERSPREHLGLVGVGGLRSAAEVVAAAGRSLERSGYSVFLVDLTQGGWLARFNESTSAVYRPEERANPSDGPLTLVASAEACLPDDDPRRDDWDRADVVLVLGEADLGVGTGHLTTWTDRVVVLVAAGKATAELLRSVTRLFTRGGPQFEFAMLVGADRTDESLGVPHRTTQERQQRRAR